MKDLNYQQARTIRKQSLKDVIADELIRGEGVGSAITNAIGLKTKARIKGFKEKFDPLNIVKFMTFGSRLGPALYGRLFGRSQKDIEYFTGRAKPIGRGGQKLTREGGEGGEDTTGMRVVLKQILTFLQKSHADDILSREKENNLKESNKLDEEKRHKELLKALGSVKPSEMATATPVAKPEEDNTMGLLGAVASGLMATVKSMINGVISQIKSIKDFIKGNIKDVFKTIGKLENIYKIISGIVSLFGFIRKVFKSPVFWLISAMVTLAEFQKYVRDTVKEGMNDAIRKAAEKGDVNELRNQLRTERQYEIDKANQTGDALDAGAYTQVETMGNITINPAEIKQKVIKNLEFVRDTNENPKKRNLAIAALDQIEAEDAAKKIEYFRKNNIDPKIATPQQLKDAQDYADEKININRVPTWTKPTIPGPPPKSKSEPLLDKDTKKVIEDIPENMLKWLESGADDSTPDGKMYKQMWEVFKQNPWGPWNFNEKIPGYNEWNRTAKPDVKTGQLYNLSDENSNLMADYKNQKLNVAVPPTMVATTSTSQKTPSQSIPMPHVRMGQDSFVGAVIHSFA